MMKSCPYHPSEPIAVDRPDFREFACGCYCERDEFGEAFTAGAHKKAVQYFRDARAQ